MKRFIIDANVLFSIFISGREEYLELIKRVKLLIPDYALTELQEHQEIILSKTKLKREELTSFTLDILNDVLVVPNFLISTQSYLQAYNWCKDIDLDDLVYVALSIEFNTEFITRDAILYEGLKQKGFTNAILWQDFLNDYL